MERTAVRERIERLVEQGLGELTPHLRAWAESHLITPKRVRLFDSIESPETFPCWLVTDHKGVNDSSYRVVYDENRNQFGFEVKLADGRELFMGWIGSFAETVENL